MDKTKLTIRLSEEFKQIIINEAKKYNYRSISAYLRNVLSENIEIKPGSKLEFIALEAAKQGVNKEELHNIINGAYSTARVNKKLKIKHPT